MFCFKRVKLRTLTVAFPVWIAPVVGQALVTLSATKARLALTFASERVTLGRERARQVAVAGRATFSGSYPPVVRGALAAIEADDVWQARALARDAVTHGRLALGAEEEAVAGYGRMTTGTRIDQKKISNAKKNIKN
jgi:hypothetical protein